MKNIILLAVQGAGKGSLAQILCNKYGYTHISMGDVMRAARNDGSSRAKIIAEYQDKGKLVPFEITRDLIKERILKPDCQNGYILDGFPRSLEQAKAYEKILEETHRDIGIVLNLIIPIEEVYSRIMGRRTCKSCGKVYNDCGGPLYVRSDDTKEAIEERIDTYFKVTAPLIDYYKNKGILYEVSSSSFEELSIAVEKILEELGE